MVKKQAEKFIAIIMAFLMVCLFVVPSEHTAYAKNSFSSEYEQTVINQSDGLEGSEINCIYQSSSGYIWVGTKSGLYRSSGQKFQSINLWDTEQSDVYDINCIYQDYEGRVWVGTDNYGLFYIENGKNHHLLNEYYEGIKTINGICGTEDGRLYIATTQGLFTNFTDEEGNLGLEQIEIENTLNDEFDKIVTLNNNVWALSNNKIYLVNNGNHVFTIDCQKYIEDEIISLEAIDGSVYCGTASNKLIKFTSRASYRIIDTSINGINAIMKDDSEKIWVCGDNGIGYINSKNYYVKVNDLKIDSYITDILQDYEGNYWIASSRMGLLLLSKSKFIDFNTDSGLPETMVNCVFNEDNLKYVGSDDGLMIYDETDSSIDNELTQMLTGTSIRHISKDKNDTLWISTYRRFGVVRVDAEGNIINISKNAGLPSMVVNCTLPLSNGNVAVATDEGIAILSSEGDVLNTYERKNGITNTNVLCLYEMNDDSLMAGTEGGGLFDISLSTGKVSNYTIENGLNSNVVTVIKKGADGIWIGTDSGLCFFNDTFRSISNIEYSNSIYDIVVNENQMWIIGSKGVLNTTEEELLSSQGLSSRYFDENDGLNRAINSFSHTVIADGLLYICCNTGLYVIDTGNIPYNQVAPKISVNAVDVDGVRYEFGDFVNGLKVDSDTSRITISFAVFSYSNRDNINIEYYLKGFDVDPIVISGSDNLEAVYTNLDGGDYEFTISATNGDGVLSESSVTFAIEKEKGLWENPALITMIVLIIVGIILLLFFSILNIRKKLISKNTALEKLSKEHEVAVKSSSAKNDYLANMSTDIKIPVNAIMVKANELLHVVEEDNPYRGEIESIYDTGKSIVDKIDDIILLAKIEAGRIDVIEDNYSITDLLCDISDYAIEKIDKKGIKFFVEVGDPLVDKVYGDYEKIKDILIRIVDNAIKYTKEGSVTLSVDCYEMSDKFERKNLANYIFTVSDTGNGISQDRINDLFEVYNIVDNVKNSYQSNSGMGLAIAKGFADMLGADIQVESVYGAGSTFTVTMNQKIVGNAGKARNVIKIDETVSQADVDKLWLPDVNALLVDDEEISTEVAVKVLSQFEMKVDIASSGISAIDMVINNHYDIVFMDLSMPVMNGIDAMTEIRELDGDGYSVLPIILMEDDKAKYLEAGFTDSVVKPLDSRRLAAILKDCLPEEKIKEKATDIEKYIMESRFAEGMLELDEYISVESAIMKIGGSIEVFNKLINAYYNQNKNAPDELTVSIKKNMRVFKTKIHSLKTMSLNIGAYAISQQATKIEAAINIGNKDYAVNLLDDFTIQLSDTLNALENYLQFIDSISGISDEEYSSRRASLDKNYNYDEEIDNNYKNDAEKTDTDVANTEVVNSDNIVQIDISTLEEIKYCALDNDFENVDINLKKLMSVSYKGEDAEFMKVLKDAVEKREVEVINELIGTYMDLKM